MIMSRSNQTWQVSRRGSGLYGAQNQNKTRKAAGRVEQRHLSSARKIMTSLFISEYGEGAGVCNGFLEIYNPSSVFRGFA